MTRVSAYDRRARLWRYYDAPYSPVPRSTSTTGLGVDIDSALPALPIGSIPAGSGNTAQGIVVNGESGSIAAPLLVASLIGLGWWLFRT